MSLRSGNEGCLETWRMGRDEEQRKSWKPGGNSPNAGHGRGKNSVLGCESSTIEGLRSKLGLENASDEDISLCLSTERHAKEVRAAVPRLPPPEFIQLAEKSFWIVGLDRVIAANWAIPCAELILEWIQYSSRVTPDSRMKDLKITRESVNAAFGLREGTRKISSLCGSGWQEYFHEVAGTKEVGLNELESLKEEAVLQCLIAILKPGPYYRLERTAATGVCLEMEHMTAGVANGHGGGGLDWGDYIAGNVVAMLNFAARGGLCYAGPYIAHMMMKAGLLSGDELRKYGLAGQRASGRSKMDMNEGVVAPAQAISESNIQGEKVQLSSSVRNKKGKRHRGVTFADEEVRPTGEEAMDVQKRKNSTGYHAHDQRATMAMEAGREGPKDKGTCGVLSTATRQVPTTTLRTQKKRRGDTCADTESLNLAAAEINRDTRTEDVPPVPKCPIWVTRDYSAHETKPRQTLDEFLLRSAEPGNKMMGKCVGGREMSNLPMSEIMSLASVNYAQWEEWINGSRIVLEEILEDAGVPDFQTLFERIPSIVTLYRESISSLERVKDETRRMGTSASKVPRSDSMMTHLCPEVLLQHLDLKRRSLESAIAWEAERYQNLNHILTQELQPALKKAEENLDVQTEKIRSLQKDKPGYNRAIKDLEETARKLTEQKQLERQTQESNHIELLRTMRANHEKEVAALRLKFMSDGGRL